MKAISLILTLCLSLNVMASTGTVQDLERSFDLYTYALTVEWDQKDEAFLEKTNQEFSLKLEELVEAGLTKQNLITFIEKKMSNKRQIQVLKDVIASHPNILTASDLAQVLNENAESFYTRGANWNSQILQGAVIGILAIGALWWMMDKMMYPEYAPCVKTNTCK